MSKTTWVSHGRYLNEHACDDFERPPHIFYTSFSHRVWAGLSDLLLMHRIWEKWWSVASGTSWKSHEASLSSGVHPGRPVACPKDTRNSRKSPWHEELRLPAYSWWGIEAMRAKVGPPAPVKPSEDCNPRWDLDGNLMRAPQARTSQPSCFRIPALQNTHKCL